MGFFQKCIGFYPPKEKEQLLGIWERRGDEFSGCLIKVEKEAEELLGKIIVSTPQMLEAGWKIGERKWRYIQSDSQERWKLLDLRKQYDTQNKKVLSTDYTHYWVSLNHEGRKMSLHQSQIPLFAAQVWRKIG